MPRTPADLVRMLGLKPNSLIVAINPNPSILAWVQEALPDGAVLAEGLPADARPNAILVWPTERDDLDALFQRLRDAIVPDGAVWAVIPKKRRGSGNRGVSFIRVQEAALKTDLVENKVLSFHGDEYGVRFVIRKERRVSPSREQVRNDGNSPEGCMRDGNPE